MLLEQSICRLKIPDATHHRAWEMSQTAPQLGLRLQIYLNQVGLETLVPWLQKTLLDSGMTVECSAPAPQQWAWVSGFSLALARVGQPPVRLVCLPSETMDRSEFRVPQEWVDLPRWAGDYYLAAEVDPDQQILEVWGYATHAQLKTQGAYDSCDRTYSLEGTEMFPDLGALGVMLQVGTEPTRSAIAPLPPLAPERCAALINHLHQPQTLIPRLQIPFAEWGALLEQPDAFAQLCHPPIHPSTPITRLSQWFDNVFDNAVDAGWRTLENLFGPGPNLALGLRGNATETEVRRAKAIHLGSDQLPLWLFVRLEPEENGRYGIRVRLLPMAIDTSLPTATRLTLYADNGEVVQTVTAHQQDAAIQLKRFRCPPGTAFAVEVAIADAVVTESFLT
ncbi:DUF1822 family protein [Leptolyngbya sp. CCNP1308]|uniref:DUF1822 family protein n=1 Tax=Leptolyngbya sp. CCNP1308 TaxID=3110255 RepID=UPI002B201957|nr:DUF1822 family protein [Leptolyngbya sp. CCNP1308]MEA5449224.1 DUF1822 family protein [Leptolyngbya sp. CCNP1308]